MTTETPGPDPSTLDELSLPRVVIVTGTGGAVGQAAVTAAVAANLAQRGKSVGAALPVQTGLAAGQPGDAELIAGLAGVPTEEWFRLRERLDPDVAARREGVVLPPAVKHALRAAQTEHDVLLLLGPGGLLTRLDARGGTLADLGTALRYKGVSVGYLAVVAAGPSALNSLALTAEALAARDLPLLGVVIGEWPPTPDVAQLVDLEHVLAVTGAPLLGVLPAGAAALDPLTFRSQAVRWFSPATWETMGA